MITELAKALTEPLTAVGRWLNPDRRREARKDGAIESAEELFKIYRAMGKLEGDKAGYQFMSDAQLKNHEVHYLKRYNAWKNG